MIVIVMVMIVMAMAMVMRMAMVMDGDGWRWWTRWSWRLMIDFRFQIIQRALLTSQKQESAQTRNWCHQSACFLKRSSSCLVCLEVPQLEDIIQGGTGKPFLEPCLSNSTRKANLTMLRKSNRGWVGVFPGKKSQKYKRSQNWLGMPRHKYFLSYLYIQYSVCVFIYTYISIHKHICHGYVYVYMRMYTPLSTSCVYLLHTVSFT